MTTPADLNALSILALVASDAAYQPKTQLDTERAALGAVFLHSFPDSIKTQDEQGIPLTLIANLPNGAQDLTAYELGSTNGSRGGGLAQTITFGNWTLIKKFQRVKMGSESFLISEMRLAADQS